MGEIEAHLARGLHRVLRDVRWFPNSCPGPRTQVATLSSLNGESLPWVQAPFTPCSHRLDGELVDMGPEGTGGNPGVQVRGGDQKLEPEQCCLPRGGDRTSEVRAASQTPLPGGESKWSEWCLRSWLSHPWDGASSPDPLLGQQAASPETRPAVGALGSLAWSPWSRRARGCWRRWDWGSATTRPVIIRGAARPVGGKEPLRGPQSFGLPRTGPALRTWAGRGLPLRSLTDGRLRGVSTRMPPTRHCAPHAPAPVLVLFAGEGWRRERGVTF